MGLGLTGKLGCAWDSAWMCGGGLVVVGGGGGGCTHSIILPGCWGGRRIGEEGCIKELLSVKILSNHRIVHF